MIEIIDNLLERKDFNTIKKFVEQENLNWKRGTMLPENLLSCHKGENYQDCFVLYSNGKYDRSELKILFPILKKLNVDVLLKAKINKTSPRETNMVVGWHTDCTEDHWAWSKNPKTSIFYINTNDGYTIVDNKKVECVENRIVIFDSHIKHTGVTCSRSDKKILININYY